MLLLHKKMGISDRLLLQDAFNLNSLDGLVRFVKKVLLGTFVIEGIGAKRKKDLLNYFGSVKAIKDASIDDIAKVSGINKKTAENIYNYFHK
jgi:5'-3' exonuclease